MIDYEGHIIIPVIYEEISCRGAFPDMIFVMGDQGKYGFFHADAFSDGIYEKILFCYDEIGDYQDGLAVVRDGAMIGNGEYDEIVQDAESYRVKKDERYGFLNAKGEEVIPAEYDFIDNWTVYQTYQCYIPVIWSGESNKDNILITGKPESGDLSPMLLQNEITPRISQFHEWVQSGSITVNDMESSHSVTAQELLENPELFFDERGNPYTKDTVLEAEYVSEYRINGEQTTPGWYYEQLERYRPYR